MPFGLLLVPLYLFAHELLGIRFEFISDLGIVFQPILQLGVVVDAKKQIS